jgi:hypothetical protein
MGVEGAEHRHPFPHRRPRAAHPPSGSAQEPFRDIGPVPSVAVSLTLGGTGGGSAMHRTPSVCHRVQRSQCFRLLSTSSRSTGDRPNVMRA